MFGRLVMDPKTGKWDSALIATTGDHLRDLPSSYELLDELEFAIDFQAERGGGIFVLALPR